MSFIGETSETGGWLGGVQKSKRTLNSRDFLSRTRRGGSNVFYPGTAVSTIFLFPPPCYCPIRTPISWVRKKERFPCNSVLIASRPPAAHSRIQASKFLGSRIEGFANTAAKSPRTAHNTKSEHEQASENAAEQNRDT